VSDVFALKSHKGLFTPQKILCVVSAVTSHNFTHCLKILWNCTRLNGPYNFKTISKLPKQTQVKFWLSTDEEMSFTQQNVSTPSY